MPRPGELTKARKKRTFKTPGGRDAVRHRTFYRAGGTCALSGKRMQLPHFHVKVRGRVEPSDQAEADLRQIIDEIAPGILEVTER